MAGKIEENSNKDEIWEKIVENYFREEEIGHLLDDLLKSSCKRQNPTPRKITSFESISPRITRLL